VRATLPVEAKKKSQEAVVPWKQSRSTSFRTRYRSPPATWAKQTKPENLRQFFKVYLEARF
jgi:hypothetical protein